MSAERFLERLSGGGIVEELVVGAEVRSPSVQMRATPLGKVEQLSTHDQLLGGTSGLTFFGSVFPASDEYAREIAKEALKVGEELARRGVIGRFSVDFLTARTDGGWEPYAIEVNLPVRREIIPFTVNGGIGHHGNGFFEIICDVLSFF